MYKISGLKTMSQSTGEKPLLRAKDARKLAQQVKDSEDDRRADRIEEFFNSVLGEIASRSRQGFTNLKIKWSEPGKYVQAFVQRLNDLGYKTEIETEEGCMHDFYNVYISWA